MLRLMAVVFLGLVYGSSCTEQHDPRRDWQSFRSESANANRVQPKLNEDGSLPMAAVEGAEKPFNIDQDYTNFCSSCHGTNGKGDGPSGVALEPKPRNFVDWDTDKDIPAEWAGKSEDYIAKVIKEGGTAVGKSASMAPWGGVMSESQIKAMVGKVKGFRK